MKQHKIRLQKELCNCCGRQEGSISFSQRFGYFSRWDGSMHRFMLCEDCYEDFLNKFQIPAKEEELTELF